MAFYNPPPTATPTAHHTTHETGGTDVVAAIDGSVITTGAVAAARGGTGTTTGLTVLSAGNVTTGTLPDAQLSTNVPLKNATNIFSSVTYFASSNPTIYLQDNAQPADQKLTRLVSTGQNVYLQSMTDAGGVVATTFSANRSGDFNVGRDIYEKGRTTPMGHWLTYTPTFTAATGTWTPGSYLARYTLIGKTVIVHLSIESSTLSSATAQVFLTLPLAGLTSGGYSDNSVVMYLGGYEIGLSELASGGTSVQIQRVTASGNLPAGAGFFVRGFLFYEIP